MEGLEDGRLDVQNKLEGCIFKHPFSSKSTEICSFLLERQSLRVQLPVLLAWPSSKDLYKTPEGSNCNSSKTKYQGSDLLILGHSNEEVIQSRETVGCSYCNIWVLSRIRRNV